MGIQGFQNMEVTGVTCSPPDAGGRAKCCADRVGASASSWAYSFCLAICVLCCMKCDINFKLKDEDGPNSVDDPKPEPGPSYPKVTPKPGGFSFTTSSYGLGLPLVFGSDRLTGNVFWSNGFEKNYFTVKKERYYYGTTSFALGICEGIVTGLVRLWIGDRLIIDNSAEVDDNNVLKPRSNGFLSGATVDLTDTKSPLRNLGAAKRTTRISVFNGSEKQLPQGVMVVEEGIGRVPGYRGVAYILFENFIIDDNGIPDITVEVTANTTTLFPRLYGDYDAAVPTLDRALSNSILFDLSYDQLLIPSSSSSTSDEGIARFDATSLENLDSYDVEGVVFDGETLGTANWDSMLLLSSGQVAFMEDNGNSGTLWVWNPFSGTVTDIMGPGGGLFGHDSAGFGATNTSVCVFQHNPEGEAQMDAYFGIGRLNNSWGVAYINKDGQIVDFVWENGVIHGDYNRPVAMYVSETFARTNPAFTDGSSTGGTHVFVVGTPGTTEQFDTELKIHRITFRRTKTTDTSDTTEPDFDVIDCDELGGAGFNHTIKAAFLDPADNCLVILLRIASRADRIIKYSPFTGNIVWNTAVTEFKSGDFQAAPIAAIYGGTFVWYDTNNILYEISLYDGEVRTLFDIDGQGLPSPLGEIGFYNAYDFSYIYTANNSGERVVKVYLDKIQRATVDLADVVTALLQRVGVSISDINTDDVAGLAMYGYTIKSPQSLRTSFSELAQAFKYDLVESNGTFLYKARGDGSSITIPHTDLSFASENGWLEATQENDLSRLRKVALTYRDIDREYNDNVQAIALPDYINLELDNDTPMEVRVPVVLEATDARKLAEILLFAKLTYNTTYEFTMAPKYMALDPGDVITVTRDDVNLPSVIMRLRSTDKGADNSIRVQASQEDPDIYNDTVNLFGEIGRYERGEFEPIPPRVDPYLLQIPGRDEDEIAAANSQHVVYLTLLNNRVSTAPTNNIIVTLDGTDSYTVDPPGDYPTWGYVQTPLDFVVNFYATDEDSSVTVKLHNTGSIALDSAADKDAMLADSRVNLALMGQELVQFRDAVDNMDGTYTLTHFHRCLHGTEQYVASHSSGEKFILLGDNTGALDAEAILKVSVGADSPRKIVQVSISTGNPFQPPFVDFYIATNLRPFSPSGINMYFESDGDVYINWHYRARYNGDLNTAEFYTVPKSEDEEYVYYLFTDPTVFNLFDPTSYMRTGTTTADTITYTAAQQTADGYTRTTDTLYFLVYIKTGSNSEDVGSGIQVNLPPLTG